MTEGIGGDSDLNISVSWSPTRPVEPDLPSKVSFGPDASRLIREASRLIREAAPVEDYRVVGVVIRLEQRPHESNGRVWILSVSEGVVRTIELALDQDIYENAIEAHRDRLPVSAVGTLVRTGPFFQLQGTREFAVLPTPGADRPGPTAGATGVEHSTDIRTHDE
jgi:hypothetical protein